MIFTLETSMSSAILLAVFLQGVRGTFPPTNHPPPIPGTSARSLNMQGYYFPEDLPSETPQTLVKSEGPFSTDNKPDEQRWYLQETQSGETAEISRSIEDFERFYPNGEPAIGPVATPIPDDTYLAQPSSLSKVDPNGAATVGSSDIWIVTRGSDNQYLSERWVPVQLAPDRVVEVLNQDPSPAIATDTIKSISAPLPPEVQTKTQITADTPPSIVQQVWVRAPAIVGSQKVISDKATIVQQVPSVKQIVDIPPENSKQIIQQQVMKDAIPVPPPAAVISKKSFTAPPPPPPPLKGVVDTTPKFISPVAVNSDSRTLISDKNGLLQPMKHIWIPTSARTGRFVTIPASNVNIDKVVVSKGETLNSAPIAVSDTWVLRQDGSVPSFEQQKSLVPPTVVQGGKVLIQNPPVIQIDPPANPSVITQFDSSKNPSVVGKTVGPAVDIWPARQDVTTSKILDKSTVIPVTGIPGPNPNSGTVLVSKSIPAPPPVIPQKSILSPKLPPPTPPVVSLLNGKPCPLPLPKSPPPFTNQIIPTPRLLVTQRKQPLTRIIRVNRYPTGNYYLLNTGIRPNYYNYPSPAFIQQPKAGLVRLIRTKQLPVAPVPSKQTIIPVPSRQTVIPLQTKQISIPVQSRIIASPVSLRKLTMPVPSRQVILPLSSPQAQTRILYPAVQAIRYPYPWNGYLNASPVPGKRVLVPQISPLKLASPGSTSSSSENSSSESVSSESSEEDKKEKPKKEKLKKEEKPKKEESPAPAEKETSAESKSDEIEKETEEASAETRVNESIEVSESQISSQVLQNTALSNSDETLNGASKPYIFRVDHRDQNGTVQHRQETSDVEGRVTGSYGYHDADGTYRFANYVADQDGFRVNVESNEPGTVTHDSAHANFISNQATDTEQTAEVDYESLKEGSTIN